MRKIIFTFIAILIATFLQAQLNTNHVMHNGRSQLYFGNYLAAIENFNMIIKTQPHLPEPYFYRGAAKLNLEDYRGSLVDLNKAIEIKPFYPDAFLYRGMVQYNLKNFEAAMNDYSKAMELEGDNADIYNNRGICKAAMRDFDGAIADYTLAIEQKPKNYNAYLNRSIAYQIQQEWDKAIDDCNQMIRIRPNSPMGYLSRGLIKIEKEDFAGAMRDFDMAIYLDPQNAFAFQNRGMVKQQLESYESAIFDYNTALNLDPYLASAYFNRGIAREMLGRDGYQQDYNMASALDPRFEKRPWQTEQEREEAYQQQMATWQQQAQNNTANKNNNTEEKQQNQQDESAKNDKIDLDELRKRRMKATLVAADSRDMPGGAQDVVQATSVNQSIHIELMPFFTVGIIDKKQADNQKFGYFNLIIENLNAANNYEPYLTITTSKASDQLESESNRNQVLVYNERIRQNNQFSNNFLYRGIFHALLKNYREAIADFDQAIKLDEHNLLAYFLRANTRSEMENAIEALRNQAVGASLKQNTPQTFVERNRNRQVNTDANDDILTDYQVVTYMNPNFFFANYNRANIYAQNEQYGQAIDEYSKAISLEPDFAEAFYNRGLLKVLLNDIEGGARDLSRAGELGIEQAYLVIKRYCN
jgi:tetratricopeptide (TPR) repeat protein